MCGGSSSSEPNGGHGPTGRYWSQPGGQGLHTGVCPTLPQSVIRGKLRAGQAALGRGMLPLLLASTQEKGALCRLRVPLWQDLPEVLQRAADAGVAACIVTGCSRASSLAAQRLCHQPAPLQLYFTAGVRPSCAEP